MVSQILRLHSFRDRIHHFLAVIAKLVISPSDRAVAFEYVGEIPEDLAFMDSMAA